MDLQMPKMDGFEATKQIRKMGLNMPIFALTANVFSDVKEKVLESGMNDYISKPFNPTELYSKLQSQYSLKNKLENNSKLTLF
jgi:CheY-like chemotaxis protein